MRLATQAFREDNQVLSYTAIYEHKIGREINMSVETIISLVIAFLATLGVGGVLGAFVQRHFEQQKQTNEHDIKIFRQSNEILSEQKLSDIANFHLFGDHSIIGDDFLLLTRWCAFFGEIGNKYLDKKINKQNQKLLNDLNQLTEFIATNFFTIIGQNPNNKSQYLKPDWNLD
jgi:hypothetical protein